MLAAVIGVSVILLVIAVLTLCCVCYRKKRRTDQARSHINQPHINISPLETQDTYAEIGDAIHQQVATADNTGNAVQDFVSISDRSPDPLPTPEEMTPSMTPSDDECLSHREGSKRVKPTLLPFPLRRPPLDKEKEDKVRTRSECISSSSAEHLYDSPDKFKSSRDPLYHVLEPQKTGDKMNCPDSPHLYHVLEGPTKPTNLDVVAKKETPIIAAPAPGPPLPPKPPSCFVNRHRMTSCSAAPSVCMEQPKDKKQVHDLPSAATRSVNAQLSSVIAIYEEVPGHKREPSPSISLPPKGVKPEMQDGGAGQEKKDHVYHVLEAFSPIDERLHVPHGRQHKQKQDEIVKNNVGSVSQTFSKQNDEESNVCKTDVICFQLALPNMTKQPSPESTEGNKYTGAFSSENRKADAHTHECHLFDDPTYCTHKHNTPPQFDDPSYATPMVSLSLHQDQIRHRKAQFDDPQYSCTPVSVKVKFDDPKYQLLPKMHEGLQMEHPMRRSKLKGKKIFRHSSSLENFGVSIYSSTSDLLEATNQKVRGGSIDALTDYDNLEGSRVRKITKGPKHRTMSVGAHFQTLTFTDV
jgi:hypothetical protein